MVFTIEKKLPSLSELPENYLINLDDLSAIILSGEEQSCYLQGQVTCDVNQLNENSLLNGAHCDAKGKMYANFRLFKRDNTHWLLQPKSTVSASLAALQKFGVFAKVEIKQTENIACFALVGSQAESRLKQQFKQIPDPMSPTVQVGTTTLLYITNNNSDISKKCQQHYLLIDNQENMATIAANFTLPIFNHDLWNLHEILNGFPIMNANSIGEYVPQMLNLQAINAISFTKGCYLGQETVARMQYLGRNKRALFTLATENKSPINNNNIIELQLGKNWRRVANILSYYQSDNGECYVQAILPTDISNANNLRLKLSEDRFVAITIKSLPYLLNTENS